MRWRDPTSDEEAIAEATAAGIQPITYTSRRWDRQVARQVWMGVSLVSGDRQDVADGLVSTAHMEYDLVLYDRCTASYFRDEEEAKRKLLALEEKWATIETIASTSTPSILVK